MLLLILVVIQTVHGRQEVLTERNDHDGQQDAEEGIDYDGTAFLHLGETATELNSHLAYLSSRDHDRLCSSDAI